MKNIDELRSFTNICEVCKNFAEVCCSCDDSLKFCSKDYLLVHKAANKDHEAIKLFTNTQEVNNLIDLEKLLNETKGNPKKSLKKLEEIKKKIQSTFNLFLEGHC